MTYFFHHASVSLTHGSLGSVSNKSTILLKNASLSKWLSNWDHCSVAQSANRAWSTWESESLQTEKKNLLEQQHMQLCGLLLLLVHGCGLLMIWLPAADLLLLMMAQWKCGDKPVGLIRVREVFEKFQCLLEEVCILGTGPSLAHLGLRVRYCHTGTMANHLPESSLSHHWLMSWMHYRVFNK